jgi:uncharacterized protein (TIGR02246 family)
MTDNTIPALPPDVENYTDRYLRAFNAGDADAVNALYADDAVAVWDRGTPLTGSARRTYVEQFLAQRPQMRTKLLDAVITNDTALIVMAWEMEAPGTDGVPETLNGVAHDVLRRDATGAWRHVIDYPWGADASSSPTVAGS